MKHLKDTLTASPVRAIKVKYLPPTNHKGSRHKATLIGTGFSYTSPFNHSLNDGGKYIAAVKCLSLAGGTENLEHFKDARIEQCFSLDADTMIYTFTL